jgi:hypothetical protein
LVKRLHELAVQSVKIVVLASMVMVAKNANQVSIAHLLRTILQPVPHVIAEDFNQTQANQAAFHAHQESTNISKEKKHVQIVKLDVQPILQGTMHQSVVHV